MIAPSDEDIGRISEAKCNDYSQRLYAVWATVDKVAMENSKEVALVLWVDTEVVVDEAVRLQEREQQIER